jgi:hypothetical protein
VGRSIGPWPTPIPSRKGFPAETQNAEIGDSLFTDDIILPGGTWMRMVNFPPGIVSELHRTDSIDYFVVLEVRQTSLVWHGDRRCFRARLFSRSKTARRRSSGKATPAATSKSCTSGTTGPIAWQGASGCLCCFEIDGASGCSLCSFRPSPSRSTANLLASTASARKAASWQWHSNGRAYGWHGCIPISRSKPTLLRPPGDPVCCQRLPAVRPCRQADSARAVAKLPL